MPTMRLFTGVGLPAAYQDQLRTITQAWKPRLQSKTTWTRPGNWHVTLTFLGDVDQAQVPELLQALESIRFAPFPMQAAGAGAFPPKGRPRVLWIGLDKGAEQLAALASQLENALLPHGFEAEGRSYKPHLTLCRVRSAHKDPWNEVAGELARLSWPEFSVNSFTLWRSVLGPNGPKYSALADFGATSV